MAKKSANPADAYRKAQRAKELKRNKEDRKKVRETQTLKKDTGGFEAEIRKLSDAERKGTLSAADKEQLETLRGEVARIKKTKEEYLEKHPEHRKFIYPNEEARLKAEKEKSEEKAESSNSRSLYGKDGRLRNPERSLYYDPVLNPYGAPPPGMPYRERPPSPQTLPPELQSGAEESDDDDDDDDDSDDEIVMPAGPAPTLESDDEDGDSDSDDSIVMPEGPPPPKPSDAVPPLPPAFPPPFPPPHHMPYGAYPPPPGFAPPFPPPNNAMMPPQHFQQPPYPQFGRGPHYGRPAPNFANSAPPPGFFPPNHNHQPHNIPGLPQRPGQQNPRSRPPPAQQHDPLSDAPHQSYQGHQAARRAGNPAAPPPPPPSSAPPPPPLAPGATPAALAALASGSSSSAGSISAAPQMRDFRKEAAAFVPAAVKRKQQAEAAARAASLASSSAPLAAAPPSLAPGPKRPLDEDASLDQQQDGMGRVRDFEASVPKRPKVQSELMQGLMGVLGGLGGGAPPKKKKEDKDGYDGFLKGLDQFKK